MILIIVDGVRSYPAIKLNADSFVMLIIELGIIIDVRNWWCQINDFIEFELVLITNQCHLQWIWIMT
jgi:hypothetical protein